MLPTGALSSTDKEHAEIIGQHFKKVFSRQDITFDPAALDGIKIRPVLLDLDKTPELEEMRSI